MRHRAIPWCTLLFACTPARSRSPVAVAPPAASARTTEPPRSDVPGEPEPAGLGTYCRVQIEIRDADRARGSATSDTSSEAAHEQAWQRACTELRNKHGLDCEDQARVRVVNRASSTSLATDEHGTRQARYEQSFELAAYRLATGVARSVDGFSEACALAAEHACRATLATDCPPGGFTILRVEGDDDPSEDPARARPPTRRTI